MSGPIESWAGYAWVRETYVLAIGINRYTEGSGFPAIQFAEADATALAPAMGKLMRAGPDESVHVTTLLGSAATVNAIRDAMQQIAVTAKPEDVFVFAFDGMGECRADNSLYYFAAYDTRALPDRTVQNPLSSRDLGVLMAQIPARKQFVILDTCGSHKALDNLHAALQPPADVQSHSIKEVHLLAPDGPSYESPKVQHGLLTAALLSGLAGGADVDHSGKITWDRLVGYLTWKLPESVHTVFDEDPREYAGPPEPLYALTIYSDAALPKAPTRGITPEPDETVDSSGPGVDYALLVGTDHYTNGWNQLNNPIHDITELHKELVRDYGFQDDPEHIFELHDPVQGDLDPVIEKLIAKKFNKNDRLLVYFAGHGLPTFIAGKPLEGYLVFSDSKLPKLPNAEDARGTMESFSDLSQKINMIGIGALHTLLVMDVCYGGLFDGRTRGVTTGFQSLLPNGGEQSVASPDELIHRVLEHPSHIYITSGDENHSVSDGLPGEGSPFSQRFLFVLKKKAEGQPYIDMAHLYAGLFSLERKPKMGYFPPGQQDGQGADFLFIPRSSATQQVAALKSLTRLPIADRHHFSGKERDAGYQPILQVAP